jgi:hypothetical protein
MTKNQLFFTVLPNHSPLNLRDGCKCVISYAFIDKETYTFIVSNFAVSKPLPAAYCDPRVGITANSDNFFTCIISDAFLKFIASAGSEETMRDMNADKSER